MHGELDPEGAEDVNLRRRRFIIVREYVLELVMVVRIIDVLVLHVVYEKHRHNHGEMHDLVLRGEHVRHHEFFGDHFF